MRDRQQAEAQLANLALFDTLIHETITIGDLHKIESSTCRAIVEACIVARSNGIGHGDTDADLLAWREMVVRACDFRPGRLTAYLRQAYAAPGRVYVTTADATTTRPTEEASDEQSRSRTEDGDPRSEDHRP